MTNFEESTADSTRHCGDKKLLPVAETIRVLDG